MNLLSLSEWNEFLSGHPEAHLLQTGEWGELKSHFGWEPVRVLFEDNNLTWGIQILFRQLPLGFTFAYLPKGPISSAPHFPGSSFWNKVDQLCRKKRAIFLKMEPDEWMVSAGWQEGELPVGFRLSPQSIQPPRTIVIDLGDSQEEILARMKQKTRYNIRLAEKKGVRVVASDNIATFYRLMETTGQRDQFGIHSMAYYQKAFDLFQQAGQCRLLMAEIQGEPIAAVMVFTAGNRSWYLYGASASHHRQLMPTYLLQWEAMKWAQSDGCRQYDLYGVPDHDENYLEENFQERSDGLWGIYRFKRGFGGKVTRSLGPWDRVYNSLVYQIYMRWINRFAGEN
jgi:peptidoglycan pentaglycine glycine transferase (the first glycine)